MAVSSTLYPNDPATGAAYLKDSPSIATLVLEFAEAAARTSAKCEALETSFVKPSLIIFVVPSADKPKAVIASVTMSETPAKSSPDAAARSITPSIPFNISSVFQPAIAMYSIAEAVSLAVYCVIFPSCFAFSDSRSKSDPVAPEIAATDDIAFSKFAPALIAPVVRLFNPLPTADTALDPIAAIAPNPIPLVSVFFRFSA